MDQLAPTYTQPAVTAGGPPVRIAYSVELGYQVRQSGADFLLNVHAARTARQVVVREHLDMDPPIETRQYDDAATCVRLLRFRAPAGLLVVRYACTVDVYHAVADPFSLFESPVGELPGEVLPYLYPSRYCESDLLNSVAMQQFATFPPGYLRVQAIRDWVQARLRFQADSSCGTTTASQSLAAGQGVCRDFAHLMIALCRAVNVPARFVTGLDYGADPALGPTDFHAYVEAYVGGRWYLFDPSGTAVPMGLVRIATGRDAADCAYATIFGDVAPVSRWLTVEAAAGSDGVVRYPAKQSQALSTDEGPGWR